MFPRSSVLFDLSYLLVLGGFMLIQEMMLLQCYLDGMIWSQKPDTRGQIKDHDDDD